LNIVRATIKWMHKHAALRLRAAKPASKHQQQQQQQQQQQTEQGIYRFVLQSSMFEVMPLCLTTVNQLLQHNMQHGQEVTIDAHTP
jgi:hypothetical protein